MTTLEFLLIAAGLVGLFSTWRQSPRWLNVLPLGIAGLALYQLVVDGYSANILPVYVVVAGLGLIALIRIFQHQSVDQPPRNGKQLTLTILGRSLGFLGLVLAVRATLFMSLPPADLSQMTWSEAFKALHQKISHEYAFGSWKRIDWEKLYATYAPEIGAAEAIGDRQAYYLALLGYASSIPDGHVWLQGDNFGSKELAVGAGYGLQLVGLEDGRIIAAEVSPGGPAAQAGLQWGTEILSWNGKPIQTAIEQTQVLWPERRGAPATLEGLRFAQHRLLTRASAGTTASISFRNPGRSQTNQVSLVAVKDGKMSRDANLDPSLPSVEPGAILPGSIGYLKINHEHRDGEEDPAVIVRDAIQLFIERNVPGVILDVRGNRGGDDDLVPQFVGYFFSERQLYERITIYFQPFNTFIRRPSPLWIEPLEPHYPGPVVVLIDQATFSSGEGIPMAIQRLPQGEVIGFYGTYGSFGMTGGTIKLPEGLTLYFPDGQSIDSGGNIQLDSDAALQGGVSPTIRVPLTEEVARSMYVEQEDVLLNFAIDYLSAR